MATDIEPTKLKQRRLAAIMFTDIEGYTTLMQQNEEKAIHTREKHRRIFNSTTSKYNGRILQYYGDGTLSIFNSAIDAVECAIEMQLGFLEDPAIPVRIGIHTGDIIISDDEIIGNGVNIASRIESLAFPGSIFISDKVFDEIKNQSSIRSILLTEFKLKNVEKPVEIYAITNSGLVVPESQKIESKSTKGLTPASRRPDKQRSPLLKQPAPYMYLAVFFIVMILVFLKYNSDDSTDISKLEKSIAVLPLSYLSEDQSRKYIADGIQDAITGHLSTIEGLRVMPRTSVEQYRGTTKTARVIGKELAVSYLVEGNFLFVDNQVSITIQLVIAESEDHVFYNEYKRDYKDVINVQGEVARTIANEIKVAIKPEVLDRIEKIPTRNFEAYDLYLQGRDAFHRFYLNRNNEDLETSLHLFSEAIQADSTFALPYAWLGRAIEYQIGERLFIDYKEDTILSLCNKALLLEPNLADGYWIRGRYFRNTGQFNKAIEDLSRAIEINPNNALAYRYLGTIQFIRREYVKAISNLKKAEKLERGNELTQLYSDLGQVYISVGEFQKAEDYFKESLRLQPNYIEGYRNLIWAEIRQGKFDEAFDYSRRLNALYPENIDSYGIMAESLANLGKYEEAERYYRNWLRITQESGEDVVFNRHRFAFILWMNNKKEEARELFNKHIEVCINSINSGGLYGKSLAAYDLAGIHALFGEKKEAYVWLKKYEEDGFIWGYHQYILIDPLFENLRNDPEFKALTQRVSDEKKAVRADIREMELQGDLNFSY